VLNREDREWRLESGRLADPDMVARALEGLQAIDTTEVISTSEAKRPDFGVDADGGTAVVVRARGKKLADVVVGTAAQPGTYLRRVGEDAVFQTRQALQHLFPVDQARWLKLRLLDGTLDDASRVVVRLAGERPFALTPTEDEMRWALEDESLLPEGFRFDGAVARSLAGALVGIRAKELVEEAPEEGATGLEGEHDSFTLTTDESEATVHLGAATGEGDVYARVDGRDALFLVAPYQAKRLRKTLADLRDLRLMNLEPDQAVGMAIDDGTGSIRLSRGAEGGWQPAPDGEQPPADLDFDPAMVDRLLASLVNLRAARVVEGVDATAAGLDSPTTRVVVELGEGATAALEFGSAADDPEGRKLVYARGNADDLVYAVNDHQPTRFGRDWELFRRQQAPPSQSTNPWANMDPETLKNLPPEVRESILKQMQEEQQKQRLLQQLQ